MKIYLFLSLFISSFRSQKVSGSEVEFYQILALFKVQSTPRAASVLSLEQGRPCARGFRMSAESGRPVEPVTVIRAARARHLRMASDGCCGVSPQGEPFRRFEGPAAFAGVPILLTDPPG